MAGKLQREVAGLSKGNKVRAEELLRHIDGRKAQVREAFYEIGRSLAELLERKLYGSLGYASFGEMLTAREIMSVAQAFKFIEVARKFTRDKALLLGPEKAYALARYSARTKEEDDPESYLTRGFPLGGKRKPVEDVSLREILEATRTAVSRQKGEHGVSERARKDAEADAAKVEGWLRKEDATDAKVSLFFRRGTWQLRIEGPAHQLARAAK